MKGLSKALIITTALLTSVNSFSAPQDRRGGGFGGGRPGGDFGRDVGRDHGRDDRRDHHRSPRMQEEDIVLRFGDELMRGQSTIFLKQEIKQQNPRINLQDMELESVRLIAKSKMGRGEASLLVGGSLSESEIVEGTPYDFNDDAPYTYDRVTFENPSRSSDGVWQLKLQGNFKIKTVVVTVKKKENIEKMKLTFNDQFQGMSVLALKRQARLQTGSNLSDFELEGVKLVAKSMHGQGQARLVVGFDETMSKTVDGNPRQYQSDRLSTYDVISFENPSYDSDGKWQIELRGNIKVKEVTLILKRKRPGRH